MPTLSHCGAFKGIQKADEKSEAEGARYPRDSGGSHGNLDDDGECLPAYGTGLSSPSVRTLEQTSLGLDLLTCVGDSPNNRWLAFLDGQP